MNRTLHGFGRIRTSIGETNLCQNYSVRRTVPFFSANWAVFTMLIPLSISWNSKQWAILTGLNSLNESENEMPNA